jgi:4-phospho-D-threonate 3-dehydrogenase / 4-phospho-D-erythronate 3-dehydrogenase
VPKEVAVNSVFRRVFAVADDLSGAAETAMALSVRRTRSVVSLSGAASADVVVVDLDTRASTASEAASAVTLALAAARPGYRVFKKIDSLLRGNVAAEIGAVAAAGYGVVVAPALPVAARTVRAGVLHVDGQPLHESDAWRAEQATPPESVAAALAPAGVQLVGLSEVRAGALTDLFAEAAGSGRILVCDTETDADLDAVVLAAARVPEGLALAGSGGLAAAVGRLRAPTGNALKGPLSFSNGRPFRALDQKSPVVVVGTADPVAVAQVERLDGFAVHSLGPDELAEGPVELPAVAGPTVIRVDPAAPVDPARARAVATGIAATVANALPGPVVLVLIGGETARRVLDALGVDTLEPVEAIHHGAVRSRLPDGGTVVTRPGSFGGSDSLVQIVRHLEQKGTPVNSVSPGNLPIVAVTMGDGAGIGPEVIVPAVLHPDTLAVCRPVVVGDVERLRQAARLVGAVAEIVPVNDPGEAVFDSRRVNVIDLGLLPADLPWGTLSAAAGEAAYQYIRVAAELAMAGKVHGICTAPLNKEALHAAGHVFPGHTELLAHLTGVDEVSMMLSTPKVKVIHVTTHIGLIDAIARIEPGLVERTVRRGHDALVRAGNANPVIGVCGINPHAGEGGLFGYGEEEEKIVPALESLRAQGIDARGPLPADTAFFLAGRGDYDLIVAMYHDQGHGPVKVLGIEAGVNLTVGLPVIRTSVDHGTAFDIAGTGKADPRSMIEALRQAAELAAAP